MVTEHAFDAVVDLGTPESDWQADTRSYPPLDLTECTRIVVVAPHPDDEILGVGGLLHSAGLQGAGLEGAGLQGAGIEIVVVAVTDGDASHPGSPTMSPADLRRVRPGESERALAHLGVTAAPMRLCFDDGAVGDREHDVADAIAPLLSADSWCLAPWRGDGHPDHEAAGRAAVAAAGRTGARVVEYPIWMWHWAFPDHPDVPWHRGRAIELSEETRARKNDAIAEFRSQIEPLSDHPADRAILPPHILDRLRRTYEVVFV